MLTHESRARLRGIALLVLSASLFGLVDGVSKLLADSQSVGQIVWARYAFALPVLIATIRPAEWSNLLQTARPGLQVVRALVPMVISVTMVLAVRHLPLAEATVILFAGPLMVVALCAPLLGERAGAASWIGVLVGFIAVIVVARPGFSELSGYTVFPLIAAVFYALFQIVTRRLGAAGEDASTTLAWTLAIGTTLAAPFAIAAWQPLTLQMWGLMIALGLVFGLGQTLMIRAFRHAPASVLTPFSYTQIISAVIFGAAVFGEFPDGWTWIGIAMIIATGAYVATSRSPEPVR